MGSVSQMVKDNLNRIFPSLNITKDTTDAEIDERLSKLPSLDQMTEQSDQITSLQDSINELQETVTGLSDASNQYATKDDLSNIKQFDPKDINASIEKLETEVIKGLSDKITENATAIADNKGGKSLTDERPNTSSQPPTQTEEAFNSGKTTIVWETTET